MRTIRSQEIFTKKFRQQQNFDSDPKEAWHYNYVKFTPIAKNFMPYCRMIYFFYQRVKDRRRSWKETWAEFKRYFKQTENALLFCKRFKMLTFSQFSSDIFFKTQRHLTYVDIIFKTEGSKKFKFWKDFYFALSANFLLQRHATYVCFRIRGTQRDYSSKPIKHSTVKRISVFKRYSLGIER